MSCVLKVTMEFWEKSIPGRGNSRCKGAETVQELATYEDQTENQCGGSRERRSGQKGRRGQAPKGTVGHVRGRDTWGVGGRGHRTEICL